MHSSQGLPLPTLVGVIGPPGAGKSTVVRALAERHCLPVFRLREAVRARPDLLSGLPPATDPLDWISTVAVQRVLHATFVEGSVHSGAEFVLLDNFPGTAEQLALLVQIAAAAGTQVGLLELRADPDVAAERIVRRRVCLVCGPDPHAPGTPAGDDPERCQSCRITLSRRETDMPHRSKLRVARYQAHAAAIGHCAASCGIRHEVVNADGPVLEVRQAAQKALRRLIPFTAPVRSQP